MIVDAGGADDFIEIGEILFHRAAVIPGNDRRIGQHRVAAFHVDETRRLNVLELLRALGDRFEQVILITHIEAVRDGLDQVISVRYDAAAAASVVESAAIAPENIELELIPAGAA